MATRQRADRRPRVLTSIWNGDGTPRFEGSDLIDRREFKRWRYPFAFFNKARRYDAVVIVGSLGFADRYQDVVAGMTLKFVRARHRPVLVVTDATWERSSEALSGRFGPIVGSWASRVFIRVLDGPHVVYCVLSEAERASFAERWAVDGGRVVFTHYPMTLSPGERARTPSTGDYLFAGGDPLRDYDLLVRATEGLDIDVRIASRRYVTAPRARLQVGAVAPAEFRRLEAGCRLVVVPLRTDTERSAGQQTYLNAIASGKPVVITDAPGVRDYVIPGEHALVVPATEGHVRAAIEHVLDDGNADEIGKMVARGRQWVLDRLTLARYTERIWAITGTAVHQHRRGRIDLGTAHDGAPVLPDA